MVNLTGAIAYDRPGRRRRRLPAWRFHLSAALSPSEEPWRRRRQITPQTRMLFFGGDLGSLIRLCVFRTQLFRVIAIEPRHATPYLLQIDVAPVERDFAERAAISVLLRA